MSCDEMPDSNGDLYSEVASNEEIKEDRRGKKADGDSREAVSLSVWESNESHTAQWKVVQTAQHESPFHAMFHQAHNI